MPLYLALLGFYSIVSMLAAYFILSYDDYAILKRFKAARRAKRINRLKPAQLVLLSSIVQYTKE